MRKQAADALLGLTATDAGVVMLMLTGAQDAGALLARLPGNQTAIAAPAATALANLAAHERAAQALSEKPLS